MLYWNGPEGVCMCILGVVVVVWRGPPSYPLHVTFLSDTCRWRDCTSICGAESSSLRKAAPNRQVHTHNVRSFVYVTRSSQPPQNFWCQLCFRFFFTHTLAHCPHVVTLLSLFCRGFWLFRVVFDCLCLCLVLKKWQVTYEALCNKVCWIYNNNWHEEILKEKSIYETVNWMASCLNDALNTWKKQMVSTFIWHLSPLYHTRIQTLIYRTKNLQTCGTLDQQENTYYDTI